MLKIVSHCYSGKLAVAIYYLHWFLCKQNCREMAKIRSKFSKRQLMLNCTVHAFCYYCCCSCWKKQPIFIVWSNKYSNSWYIVVVVHVRLPWKVFFHQRLPSIKGCLPSKIVFYQRTSSIKGHLPSNLSILGCLPSKVIFNQRLSSLRGCLSLLYQMCSRSF